MEDNWKEILEKESKDAAIELTSAIKAKDKILTMKQKPKPEVIESAIKRANNAWTEYNNKWKACYESMNGPLEVKKSTD